MTIPRILSQTRFALPIFLTQKNKYAVGWTVFGFAAGFYLWSNHYHLFPPRSLPMTWIDQAVPFVPWTVWIYLSEYLLFGAIFVFSRDMENLNRYLYSFIAIQTLSVIIFWLTPTTYPRDLFPLPESLDRVTYTVFTSLRITDTPANCAPSLHVSSCFLSSFIYLDEQREKFPIFFIWAVLVAVSTMTTKQHYLVDVVLGVFMAVVAYWVFHRYVPYRDATEPKR